MDFTIITVCYNAESNIDKTIKSVLNQKKVESLEYLIVDGKSYDNTLQLAKKYEGVFKQLNITYKIFSEKDDGIYDAMNKGVKLAEGRYILFLNCGDVFTDEYSLYNMRQSIFNNPDLDILFGNVLIQNSNINKKLKFSRYFYSPQSFVLNRMICHQAIWAKREVLEEHPFNTQFKLCADREWLAYCCKKRKKYLYIDIDICIYNTEGISSMAESLESMRDECDTINKMYFPVLFIIVRPLITMGRNIKRFKEKHYLKGGEGIE